MSKLSEHNLSLLFVCLGNICRSPLAEAAFRQEAERIGLKIHMDSAGTGSWHIGAPPDKRAQEIARKHGIDISCYKGRQVSDKDFSTFSHIFTLDLGNLKSLQAMQPKDSKTHVSLLLDIVPGKKGKAVADPYYGGKKDFERTWQEVSEAAKVFFSNYSD